MSNAKTVMSQAANTWAGPTYIEDVFSTYLYTGNGSTQTITNGIDLAGEGGLVWIKERGSATNHSLVDSERGVDYWLRSNQTAAQISFSANSLSPMAFNSDGFTTSNYAEQNVNAGTFASWTFRKAPRFFDVVTYTGTGSAPNIVSHNLGVTPGFIMVKCTSTVTDWACQHIDLSNYLKLNSTQAASGGLLIDPVTDTTFKPKNNPDVNASGQTYVAYLFAHDPLGPSGDGSDGLIACGSYTGNGSTTGPVIDLGWEPQWVMIKRTDLGGAGYDWFMFDAMRGMPVGGADLYVDANSSDAETGSSERFQITPTGFKLATTSGSFNASGGTYIYIAIRRGPMRQPTSGTEVFAISTRDATPPQQQSGFPVDMVFEKATTGSESYNGARLIGSKYISASSTAAEATGTSYEYDYMDGWRSGTAAASNWYSWMFRRAPGFFDVVAYTGNGVAGRTVSHNLGVAPEMMIVKRRDGGSWIVYHAGTAIDPETDYLILNATNGVADNATMWNDTAPSDTVFTLGSSASTNANGSPQIAYLFATLPGVSKVGSYTGNGTSQTIDCGFTSGARFVLIKSSDATGSWYIWDTARGIVAANDPHLVINNTGAQVTTGDSVDPDSSGFIVNQSAASNVNASGASYIFYAIA